MIDAARRDVPLPTIDRIRARAESWARWEREVAEGRHGTTPENQAALDRHTLLLAYDAMTGEKTTMDLKIKRVGNHDLPLPAYAKPGDAGLDLRSNFDVDATRIDRNGYKGEGLWKSMLLCPGAFAIIDCGFAFEIPDGYEGQVRGRSGLAFKSLIFAAHLGTIDAGYRDSVKVLLHNGSAYDFEIKHGDRIAQLVVAPVARCNVVEVAALSDTERGANGFGSTGAR